MANKWSDFSFYIFYHFQTVQITMMLQKFLVKCWEPCSFKIILILVEECILLLEYMSFVPIYDKFLSVKVKTLVRSKILAENLCSHSRSIFSRPCALARAQNVLSAIQFCAHFKILESFQFTLIQQFLATRQAFMSNISLIPKKC